MLNLKYVAVEIRTRRWGLNAQRKIKQPYSYRRIIMFSEICQFHTYSN